jgi:hypothetical protein
MKNLISSVEVLDLSKMPDNGVVVVKSEQPMTTHQRAKFADEVKRRMPTGKSYLLLFLTEDASMALLDEKQMAEHGWIRKPNG